MIVTQHHLTFLFYVTRVIRLIQNWPLYLANYAGRRRRPAEYIFRSGLRLIDATGTLAGTIAVVFVRREYGTLSGCKTIIDIGANMGCFSMYAAKQCPSARILSFEPDSANFGILQQNISSNGYNGKVKAYELAVAGKSEIRELRLAGSPLNSLVMEGNTAARRNVKCVTISEIISSSEMGVVDFLKINCEGAEYEILETCPESDLKRIRRLAVEHHTLEKNAKNGRVLARFLESRGFVIERFTRYKNVSGFIWATRVI